MQRQQWLPPLAHAGAVDAMHVTYVAQVVCSHGQYTTVSNCKAKKSAVKQHTICKINPSYLLAFGMGLKGVASARV
jgi:hypothetical protein